jgi:hypothetical protein
VDGTFRIENLQPGTYEVEVNNQGFTTVWRRLTLQVGDHVTVNFELNPGPSNQRVEIRGDISGVNTSDFMVAGSVSRTQIENLPLNGRNYLELAQLEPGVNVLSVSNPGAGANNYQRVNIAGAFFSQGRISIDGSTVGDRFLGGTTQNFSQESVQEFQILTFSFDLSTGVTGAGSINIVSRRGGNDLHGTAFFYYRDHHLAAYPSLRRDPRNPDPFFARRQSGLSLSGPLKRDQLFWFANYEHNNQDGAYAIHVNAGVQRGLRPNLLLSVDYVMRRYVHLGAFQGVFLLDRNRFNRPRVTGVNQSTGVVSFVRDPIIPLCTPAQTRALDPGDECSAGPINIYASGPRAFQFAARVRFSRGDSL